MTDYPEADEASPETPREDDGEETTLVPKSMCKNAKVGDVIKFKVVSALEDELEVEHAGSDKDKESKPDGDGEMDQAIEAIPRMG